MSVCQLSIIVPVYNEASQIESFHTHIQSLLPENTELIFVDGGSSDATVEKLIALGCRVEQSVKGRANQMNHGARIACGKILMFLHIDTWLPDNFKKIFDVLIKMEWGFFLVRLNNASKTYRIIEHGINFRSTVFKVGTGDQAIFVNRQSFLGLGGYEDLPLMEDIELSRLLKSYTKPFIIRTPVVTSARRWESRGVVRTVLLMWTLQLAFKCGVPANVLAKMY